MTNYILAAIILTVSCFSQSPYYHTVSHYDAPESEGREHVLDVERMVMRVGFVANDGIVKGTVTHVYMPKRLHADSVVLDGIKMRINSVTVSGKPARFYATDTTVVIFGLFDYGKRDSITIGYECTPRVGMYFTGWNDKTNRARKQIWTQGQAFDNRHWCPMYDYPNDKMITETYVTFDGDYEVLSNGNLIDTKKNADGTKTWHYTMTKPHASYLVMIGIGKYAVEKRKTKRGLPVNLWYYPEYPERIAPTYKYSTEMIDFMEELLGVQFPWETYSQIPLQDYVFGAMENTTATTFGDFSLTDARGVLDRNYMGTNSHELTHQWFGDFITQRNEKSIWLHESFATFYPKLFFRKFYSEDHYQWMRRGEQNSALSASEKDRLPIVHPSAGGTRIYPKGSAVLDMLKYVVGEENFHRAVASYLKKHAYSNVHTDEFYLAFADELGYTLDWFFDEWLYRGGEPWYKVKYADIRDNTSTRRTVFTVEQFHQMDDLTRTFRMPIVFEVHYTDGTTSSVKADIRKQTEEVVIPNTNNKDIAYTLFDPGSYVIKKVEFKKSFSELQQQALQAPNMIDRYDAIKAIKDDTTLTVSAKLELFNRIFDKEKFHAIKGEIVAYASDEKNPISEQIIKKAIKDSDVEVRKAAINNAKKISQSLKQEYEVLLKDSSYSIIESTLQKLSDAYPEDMNSYLAATANEVAPHARVRIKHLELKALNGDTKAFEQLTDFTSNAFEFMTRQNAMNALKRLNHCSPEIIANIVDAMISQNNRLAGVASGVMEYFAQQSKYKKMYVDYKRAGTWKEWQKDILDKIAK
ncbi:MAG: M1 family metallopeptidase [Candidatus Kapaibacterium sp.]|nr:M1 family metallopeptidase [Bacteroidota bacterium]